MTAHPCAITAVNRVFPASDVLHTGARRAKSNLAAVQKTHGREMIFKAFGIALVALAAALPARPQDKQSNPVEARLEVRKVTRSADGREHVGTADTVKPGDVLEYVVTYRNRSGAAVSDFAATLPIPEATELVAGSERPAGARASVDARSFAAVPLKRTVRREGREIEEAVPMREYRALRWYVPRLGAGETLTYTARVKVLE
jgi:uncharacterized repeat protein (TIGR01451 family)